MSLILLYFSVTDFLYRRIPNVLTHSVFIVLVLYRLCAGPMYYLFGLVPAIIFLILYFINPDFIGAGDIKLFAIIGLCVDFQMLISIFFWMCLTSICFMFGGRVLKKKGMNRLPLAPFITFGWIVTLISGG
ncbi:prepilin peptidase [Paenibacillus alvei]|uniref:prepilin peptidase n=1 Tax=Paenibacillus alvei TaxID=44250 RepID=UPI003AF275E6